MIGTLGVPQLLIIAGILILIFGVGRISGLGRELGGSIKEFRRAVKDEDSETEEEDSETANTVQATAAPPAPAPPAEPAPPANPNNENNSAATGAGTASTEQKKTNGSLF